MNRGDRKLPFVSPDEERAVTEEFVRRIEREAKASRETYLSRSNIYLLKHGRHWRAMQSSDPADRGQVRTEGATVSLDTRKIVEHDIPFVLAAMAELSGRLEGVFVDGMLDVMSESTRASGNIVTNRGFKASFEEALSKISFGVDKFGRPSPPQMLVPPTLMAEVRKLFEKPDREFEARIAAIKESKEKDAIEEEVRRLSRYRWIR